METTPFFAASAAASAIAFASSVVDAIGFSQITCFPAFNAAIETAACSLLGVQTLTISISGSLIISIQSVHAFSNPYLSLKSSAISGTMSHTVLNTGMNGASVKSFGIFENATMCAFPIKPAPTKPMFIFFII